MSLDDVKGLIMVEELNITTGQALILIPILLFIAFKLWRYQSPTESHRQAEKHYPINNTNEVVKSRYGAVIQIKTYN